MLQISGGLSAACWLCSPAFRTRAQHYELLRPGFLSSSVQLVIRVTRRATLACCPNDSSKTLSGTSQASLRNLAPRGDVRISDRFRHLSTFRRQLSSVYLTGCLPKRAALARGLEYLNQTRLRLQLLIQNYGRRIPSGLPSPDAPLRGRSQTEVSAAQRHLYRTYIIARVYIY